jgi:hypothetical protein
MATVLPNLVLKRRAARIFAFVRARGQCSFEMVRR